LQHQQISIKITNIKIVERIGARIAANKLPELDPELDPEEEV
jgi:hypothetical protein